MPSRFDDAPVPVSDPISKTAASQHRCKVGEFISLRIPVRLRHSTLVFNGQKCTENEAGARRCWMIAPRSEMIVVFHNSYPNGPLRAPSSIDHTAPAEPPRDCGTSKCLSLVLRKSTTPRHRTANGRFASSSRLNERVGLPGRSAPIGVGGTIGHGSAGEVQPRRRSLRLPNPPMP